MVENFKYNPPTYSKKAISIKWKPYLCDIKTRYPKNMSNAVAGFSKLSKEEKINWIAKEYFPNPEDAISIIKNYWNADEKLQKLHDEFIENTISNFYIPLGVAPNFLINGKYSSIPMAIEESSVVAAASKSAKFWSTRGGFKATVIDTEKIGQVHFIFNGDESKLELFFTQIKDKFFNNTESITKNMQKLPKVRVLVSEHHLVRG